MNGRGPLPVVWWAGSLQRLALDAITLSKSRFWRAPPGPQDGSKEPEVPACVCRNAKNEGVGVGGHPISLADWTLTPLAPLSAHDTPLTVAAFLRQADGKNRGQADRSKSLMNFAGLSPMA